MAGTAALDPGPVLVAVLQDVATATVIPGLTPAGLDVSLHPCILPARAAPVVDPAQGTAPLMTGWTSGEPGTAAGVQTTSE